MPCVWVCKPLQCQCCCATLPLRVVLALMCALGIVVLYGQRCSMTVAITRIVIKEIRSKSTSCPIPNSTREEPKIEGDKEYWTELDQEIILSTFFVGYLLSHLPGGLLADRFGGKYVLVIGHLVSSVITGIMPFCVKLPVYGVAIIRALIGLSQGVIYPGIAALIAKWVPFEERSTLGALTFASYSLGIAIGNLLSGMVMSIMASWPAVFYFWAILGVIWNAFFFIYVFSSPATHPNITQKEKSFLEEKMPPSRHMEMPWKRLFLDKGVLIIVICQIGNDMSIYLLATNIPKYISDVLHADITVNAIMSSIPFIAMWLGSLLFGKIIDYILEVRKWSIKWVRRIGGFIGFVLSTTFILLIGYVECSYTWVAIMFTLSNFSSGPLFATFKVNHMDITVNFNGIVMAYINGVGAIGGIIPPYIIASVAEDNTIEQWKIVFWILWSVNLVCGLIYLFFGQVERAEWDVPPEELEKWKREKEERKAEMEKMKQEKREEREKRKQDDLKHETT